jgi:hypothetical protein
LGAIADRHFDDIEDHAIEVQEDPVAETDVVAIVAKERRADHGARADMTETLGQQRVALRVGPETSGRIAEFSEHEAD